MRTALVAGSFDPVTHGHIDLVRRAALLFDRVIALAVDNADKAYLFTREERLSLLRRAVEGIPGAEADTWDGMLWHYARDHGVCAIVKGIRSAEDAEYELLQARFNAAHWPAAQTVLLPASGGLEDVSSSQLKLRAMRGEKLSHLAPDFVCRAVTEKIKGQDKGE